MLGKYPFNSLVLMIGMTTAFLLSCAYTTKDIENRNFKAHPVPSDQVQVIKNEDDVTHCQYIASLKVRGGIIASLKAKSGSNEMMIKKLREEAGQLGANVLYIIEAKPEEITKEDVEAAVLGYAVVTITVGALTGDTVAPSSSSETDSMNAKAYYCE